MSILPDRKRLTTATSSPFSKLQKVSLPCATPLLCLESPVALDASVDTTCDTSSSSTPQLTPVGTAPTVLGTIRREYVSRELARFMERDPYNDYNAIGFIYQLVMYMHRGPKNDPDCVMERRVVNAAHELWRQISGEWGRTTRHVAFMGCLSVIGKFAIDDYWYDAGYDMPFVVEATILRLVDWALYHNCMTEARNDPWEF